VVGATNIDRLHKTTEQPPMPSFDVVSEVDMHEVTNAVDQASREVGTRFDFKGTDSSFAREGDVITLASGSEFQLKQMLDILQSKLARRGVDIACLKVDEPEVAGKVARQKVTVRQGLQTDLARDIVRRVKDAKLKVQAQIQGDKVRVTGKKRDDLQQVIALLRAEKLDMPLQYNNFRD
jgi:cyclic-di-GMP-binding protein